MRPEKLLPRRWQLGQQGGGGGVEGQRRVETLRGKLGTPSRLLHGLGGYGEVAAQVSSQAPCYAADAACSGTNFHRSIPNYLQVTH